MRNDYRIGELDEASLPGDPFVLFESWFRETCSAGVIEPNAMSLATATATGQTSLRTVLCKGYDRSGFVFYTNLESTKATQIAENSNVSLLFPWLKLERQVIVNGNARKMSAGEVLKYFVTRPFESRLAAWTSRQSSVVTTRKLLEKKFEEMKRKFASGEVPLPSFWGGFRVNPRTIEFWQGRPSRLHDRFLYTRLDDLSWKLERLAP
jgi:pyridoxamine 5'-phosphate oxidase